jgi:hypothetical protein
MCVCVYESAYVFVFVCVSLCGDGDWRPCFKLRSCVSTSGFVGATGRPAEGARARASVSGSTPLVHTLSPCLPAPFSLPPAISPRACAARETFGTLQLLSPALVPGIHRLLLESGDLSATHLPRPTHAHTITSGLCVRVSARARASLCTRVLARARAAWSFPTTCRLPVSPCPQSHHT